MKSEKESIEDIKAIRRIMEDSSRFLSLSGLSGVFAGILAITGALVAWFFILGTGPFRFGDYFGSMTSGAAITLKWKLLADAGVVLLLSLFFAFCFSIKKAGKDGKSIWNSVSRRLLANLFLPLFAGGVLVIALMINNQIHFIIPCFLVFYGLALVNAGKFTMGEVYYLGIIEMITGLVAAFVPGWSLLFWIFGFGILHIGYGVVMYRKLGV